MPSAPLHKCASLPCTRTTRRKFCSLTCSRYEGKTAKRRRMVDALFTHLDEQMRKRCQFLTNSIVAKQTARHLKGLNEARLEMEKQQTFMVGGYAGPRRDRIGQLDGSERFER